jgi:hypothetical protein
MNGGMRPGAGRPKGSQNRRTTELRELAERGIENALSSDLSPLCVMLAMMRGDQTVTREMFEAAQAAAPYVHPRLASTTFAGEVRQEVTVVDSRPDLAELVAEFARISPNVAPEPRPAAVAAPSNGPISANISCFMSAFGDINPMPQAAALPRRCAAPRPAAPAPEPPHVAPAPPRDPLAAFRGGPAFDPPTFCD